MIRSSDTIHLLIFTFRQTILIFVAHDGYFEPNTVYQAYKGLPCGFGFSNINTRSFYFCQLNPTEFPSEQKRRSAGKGLCNILIYIIFGVFCSALPSSGSTKYLVSL